MKDAPSRSFGFSLVEVVMALGLFTFCVVAIVGLLGVGLGAARSVANECAAVNIAESIYGGWQAQQDATQPLTVTNLFTNLPTLATAASEDLLYFDGSGVQVASAPEAAFEVLYTVIGGEAQPNQPLVSTLQLDFRWPPGAPTNAAQTRSYTRLFVKNP